MLVTYYFRQPQPHLHSLEELFATVLDALPEDIRARKVELPAAEASLRGLWRNSAFARRCQGDVNHIAGHVNYCALALDRPTVLTIPDVRSSLTGGFIRNMLVKALWFWLPALKVSRITVISEFTAKEVARLIPFARGKIQVIYCPVNRKLKYAPKALDAKEPRILHIGTKPNKNLERTARALEGIPCKLAIIGAIPAADAMVLKEVGIAYENYVDLPYEEVVRQYELCDLVCFASTYEGFGMPIVEANAVGRPVVAGRAGAMPEVAGDAACLVDPYDVEAIRSGVLRVIRDQAYRETLVRNGLENVKRFAPETIASQYAQVYREVAKT